MSNPSDFLVVEDPDKPSTFHLQVKTGGKPDHRLMGAAYAALTSNHRGKPYQGPNKAEALSKLEALYKSEGMEVPSAAAEPPQHDRGGGDNPDHPADDVWLAPFDDDDDDDADDETAEEDEESKNEVSGKRKASSPDTGDTHAPGALENVSIAYRSPTLKRFIQGLRKRFTLQAAITAADVEAEFKTARGHAGGKAPRKTAAEQRNFFPCEDCLDGAPQGCQCAECADGNHDDCLCCTKLARQREAAYIMSETGEGFRVFLPAAFADAPQWIPYLPKPGAYTHPNWGKVKITPERNADFVSKFASGVYQDQLPIDAEHQTKASGAMGWINQLRQNGDGSVDARVSWTDRGRHMLAEDRFKYISPEFYEEWPDPIDGQVIKNVAIGAALTTRPFFKPSALRPLVATENGLFIPAIQEVNPMAQNTAPAQPAEDNAQKFAELKAENDKLEKALKAATEKAVSADPAQLTEEEIRRFREIDPEYAQLRQAAEKAQEESKKAAEQVDAWKHEARLRSFAETAQSFTGTVETHVAVMDALSDELRQQYIESQTAIAEQIKTGALFSQLGRSGHTDDGSAEHQIRTFAEQAVSEAKTSGKPISLAQGYAAVMAAPENRELMIQYNKEHSSKA